MDRSEGWSEDKVYRAGKPGVGALLFLWPGGYSGRARALSPKLGADPQHRATKSPEYIFQRVI